MANKKLGILFLVSVVLAFIAGYYISVVIPPTQTGSTNDVFDEITTSFRNFYYYDIEDAEVQDAFIASMKAMIDSYAESNNDPYTRLVVTPLSVTPSSDEMFIGIGIGFLMEDLNLRVSYIYAGGAADGLIYPNDLIIGIVIDSQNLYFDTLGSDTEVLSYLSGALDDTKTLLVTNPDGDEYEVAITYIEIPTPTAYTVDLGEANIEYIKITNFSGYIPDVTPGTAKTFSDILNELEVDNLDIDSGTKTLIIDLRDNPGGSLSALHNGGNTSVIPGITQQLLTNNVETPLFQMIPKSGVASSFYGSLTVPKGYDIAVLVNERSASAAEVLAAVLNTYGGYPLYGNFTYGKGVFQNTLNLYDINDIRYSLVYTEGEWFYDDGKNVAEDALDVNIIEQEGIKAFNMPVYNGEVLFNQVALELGDYQAFLNYYYDLSGLSMLRTDGYFDSATQNLIEDFQLEQNLVVTSILDRQTAIRIHEIYSADLQDLNKDVQLQTLIDLINSSL
ncbi:MAG: peptidoglycan-binding protein [Firmicutes bacterium]|nr:peptidoglycan-binding protein [Bacillota bacterium]